MLLHSVQRSSKEWSLGCVKRAPIARGSRDAGIRQPRDHSLAIACILKYRHVQNREKVFVCFDKQQPGRARQKFLATTYKDFFSALYMYTYLLQRLLETM